MKVLIVLAALMAFAAARNHGGAREVELKLTDPAAVAATNAINEHFQESEGANAAPRTALNVMHATAQTVAGVKYSLTLRVFNGEDANEICHVTVLERLWLSENDHYSTSDVECEAENPSPRAGLLGGENELPLNDPEAKEVLESLISFINSNEEYLHISKGGTITKQVVNGVIYRVKGIQFLETTCLNDQMEGYPAEKCPLVKNHKILTCHAKLGKNAKTENELAVQEMGCAF